MKFYFCEACGKRVTENHIADGMAKDKKLRGVYCKECATGVLTVETLPLTNDQAKRVLSKNPSSGSPGIARSRAIKQKTIPDSETHLASSSNAYIKIIFILGPVTVTLLFALFLTLDQGVEKRSKEKFPPKPPNQFKKKKPSKERLAVARAISPTPDAPPNTREAGSNGDEISQVDSPPPAPAEALTIDEKPQPADPKPSLPQMATPPMEEVPEPKQQNIAAARKKYSTMLESLDRAWRNGALEEADEIILSIQADTLLVSQHHELKSLKAISARLAQIESEKNEALKALMDGHEHSIPTHKRIVKGIVRKIEENGIRIRIKGKINQQSIEYERMVKWEELTPEGRTRLFGNTQPSTPCDWLAEAILKIAAGELKGAVRALSSAPNHPLHNFYRIKIKELETLAREEHARQYWGNRIEPLLKVRKFSKDGAASGAEVLKTFRASFGLTVFFASKVERIQGLKRAFQAALGPPKAITLNLVNKVNLDFVLIYPGTFNMGEGVKSHRQVTLTKAYYLGKFEITDAQYYGIMTPRKHYTIKPNYPVGYIGRGDAMEFCRKLSIKFGKKVRLPTEAEWEYACRAGNRNSGGLNVDLNAIGWFKDNSNGETQPVGQKAPNKFGLYDMQGNVSEWCQDWYGIYPKGPATDPQGPSVGKRHVIRGGGAIGPFWSPGKRGRTQGRGFCNDYIGFRVLMEP